jgi:Beta-ketoacyl synthase, N-terminal domain
MSPISHDGNSSTPVDRQNGHSKGLNGNGITANGSHVNGHLTNGNGTTNAVPEPMAIIGMACEFPQDAVSPESFWKLLLEGRSAMTEFPKEKLNIDSHYHPDPTHGSSVGGLLC